MGMFGYDIGAAVFFLLCSLGILHTTRNMPPPLSGIVGPGFWPGFLGHALLLLSVGLGVEALWRRYRSANKSGADDAEGGEPESGKKDAPPIDYRSPGMRKVYILCGIFAAFCVLLHFLGFMVAAVFISFSCAWLLGERAWWKLLLITLCVPAGMYVIFVYFLRLALP